MIVALLTLALLDTALLAANLAGGELARAIDGDQIIAIKVAVGFQCLVPLKLSMHCPKCRAQTLGCHRVQNRAQLRVARCSLDAVECS